MYKSLLANEAPIVPEPLKLAFEELVKKGSEDPALTARLMELPKTHYLSQFLTDLDPICLHQAYKAFYTQMAEAIQTTAVPIYTELENKNLGHSAKDGALRAYKNVLLSYIYKNDEESGAPVFYKQFSEARNMTDSLAALSRLSYHGGKLYDEAMNSFRDRWHEDALVLNKLFVVSAISKADDAFKKIKDRFYSEDFDKTNPNNIYALLYYFAQHNWSQFHDPSGEVYDWFAEQTIDVDSRNPQVASRLGSCFNNWKRFAPQYQEGMKKALEKIKNSSPSDNLYEIVSRALL